MPHLSQLTALFEEDDIKRWFEPNYLNRGRSYLKAVSRLQIESRHIASVVQGTSPAPYRVSIDFNANKSGKISIDARCSCPVTKDCKHAAATLLAALATREETPVLVRPGVFQWVEQLKAIAATNVMPAKKRTNRRSLAIFYIIKREPTQHHWQVHLIKATLTPEGEIAPQKNNAPNGRGPEEWASLESALIKPPAFVDEEDIAIFKLLLAQRNKNGISTNTACFPLNGRHASEIVQLMLDTGRLHASREERYALLTRLSEGGERPAQFAWEACELGTEAVFHAEPPSDFTLPINPPWYIDLALREMGPLTINLPADLITHLGTLAPLSHEEALIVATELRKVTPNIPLPLPVGQQLRHIRAPLRPVFRVSRVNPGNTENTWIDVGIVEFHYDDVVIFRGEIGNWIRQTDGKRVQVERDTQREQELLDELYAHGFSETPAHLFQFHGERVGDEVYVPNDPDLWFDFTDFILPDMQEEGWQVYLPGEFHYHTQQADEWFADLEERDSQWFSLALGIVVDGKKYPLAPLIHSLLKREDGWANKNELGKIPDDRMVKFTLPDGTRLALPAGRLKPLVATMIDILDAPTRDPLQVSHFDLPRIIDITTGADWKLSGEDKVRAIATRLKGGLGVQTVEPPEGFNATLRGYQKEGLAWLQYLRAHDLAGILADDMGLGKTAQTLAHLLTEKNAGRLGPQGSGPALIILPTSLIFNWKREAERFAPALNVLSLHGAERKDRFGDIPQNDVVLTTYPLLWRDAEILKTHTYHTLVLDEAQTVKNAASKAAETVRTINAKHRLCLTGTPLENHLGELWAQFDFLMPGLLGDIKNFTKTWRNPIEKRGDAVRRDILARRLRPFILRRKKEEVAKELPPKTIILRTVELTGAQRDLYEIVRATMDSKVREEIASKGYARSQIVILDALLKLRQVCCDPRLLKSESAKRVKERAKLDLLMDMLPELVDEGRRVLVFSQFAGMLDLIEPELEKNKLDFVRISGETKDREGPIERFQNCEVPIFLISLKAGGVGLNLTAADTVIHYDPWWNPAAENQATDRAHRIGQTKQVFVYKLIAAGSIEEKILALQEKKAALAEGILSDDAVALGKFSESDIAALLAPLPR